MTKRTDKMKNLWMKIKREPQRWMFWAALLGFLCLFFAITPIVFAGYILIITGILTVLINYAKDSKPQ